MAVTVLGIVSFSILHLLKADAQISFTVYCSDLYSIVAGITTSSTISSLLKVFFVTFALFAPMIQA